MADDPKWLEREMDNVVVNVVKYSCESTEYNKIEYIVNGRKVSMKELRKGVGIGEKELPALKNAR